MNATALWHSDGEWRPSGRSIDCSGLLIDTSDLPQSGKNRFIAGRRLTKCGILSGAVKKHLADNPTVQERMMKAFQFAVLCILVFLAISSGVTKILLMPQDAEFFGKYGFTSFLIVAFGALQVIGGLMMIFLRTRLIGAALVAFTFLISAVLLVMDGNVAFTIATVVALVFLGLTMRRNLDVRRNIQPEGKAK